MSHDALAGWALTASIAIYMAFCFARGRIWTRYGTVERSRNPRQFWMMIAISGVFLFVAVFIALYFTLPALPDHPV